VSVPGAKSNELNMYLSAGLATTPAYCIPIEFNPEWGSKQMNSFFREKLPYLFKHFAKSYPLVLTIAAESDNIGISLDEIEWPYSLVMRWHNKIELVSTIKHPTARNYLEKLTTCTTTCSWTKKTICLCK
jgi:hypothetical protein